MSEHFLEITSEETTWLQPIAELHRRTFPTGLISQLGESFIEAYYRALLETPGCGLIVAAEGEELVGFIGYTANNEVLMKASIFQEAKRAAWKRLLTGRLSPVVLLRAILKKRKGRRVHGYPELLAIAVSPKRRRGGIGKELVTRMKEKLAAKDIFHYCVYSDNPEGIQFYRKQGLETVFLFRLGGVESGCFLGRIQETETESH